MLSLTALILSLMKEVEAAEFSSQLPLLDSLDDDNINPKDLELNGVVDLFMRDGRHYTLNDPGQTIVIAGMGPSAWLQIVPARMAELQRFQQDALASFAQGPVTNPTSTGGGGSSSSPDLLLLQQGLQLQPINFDAPIAPHNSLNLTTAALSVVGPPVSDIFITGPVVRTIDVAPVVDQSNFKIGEIVTITDNQPSDTVVPYVPGTGTIGSAVDPSGAPAGINLASLVRSTRKPVR